MMRDPIVYLHDATGALRATVRVSLTGLNDMPDHVTHNGVRYRFWKMHWARCEPCSCRRQEWQGWYRI